MRETFVTSVERIKDNFSLGSMLVYAVRNYTVIQTIWRLAGPGYQWDPRVRERHWNIETVPATFQRHLPTRSLGKRDSDRDLRKSADPHTPHLGANSTR